MRLLQALKQQLAGRVPLPAILVGTKIDCAPPARQWQPERINLLVPSTEKERNILDWMHYAEKILAPLVGGCMVYPCASGAFPDDKTQQYGLKALRQRIYDT